MGKRRKSEILVQQSCGCNKRLTESWRKRKRKKKERKEERGRRWREQRSTREEETENKEQKPHRERKERRNEEASKEQARKNKDKQASEKRKRQRRSQKKRTNCCVSLFWPGRGKEEEWRISLLFFCFPLPPLPLLCSSPCNLSLAPPALRVHPTASFPVLFLCHKLVSSSHAPPSIVRSFPFASFTVGDGSMMNQSRLSPSLSFVSFFSSLSLFSLHLYLFPFLSVAPQFPFNLKRQVKCLSSIPSLSILHSLSSLSYSAACWLPCHFWQHSACTEIRIIRTLNRCRKREWGKWSEKRHWERPYQERIQSAWECKTANEVKDITVMQSSGSKQIIWLSVLCFSLSLTQQICFVFSFVIFLSLASANRLAPFISFGVLPLSIMTSKEAEGKHMPITSIASPAKTQQTKETKQKRRRWPKGEEREREKSHVIASKQETEGNTTGRRRTGAITWRERQKEKEHRSDDTTGEKGDSRRKKGQKIRPLRFLVSAVFASPPSSLIYLSSMCGLRVHKSTNSERRCERGRSTQSFLIPVTSSILGMWKMRRENAPSLPHAVLPYMIILPCLCAFFLISSITTLEISILVTCL